MRRWYALFAVIAGLAACKSNVVDVTTEGDEANECRDGADNDQDALFDCDDEGCMGSPDCEEGDADTDADTDADSDTDTDTDTDVDKGIAGHLESVTLTYDLELDFSSIMEGYDADGDGEPEAKDCINHYVGDGTYIDSKDDHVTMRGEWTLESSDCHEMFQTTDLVWYDPVSQQAYHTFHFDSNLVLLDTWVAHKNAPQIDPQPNPHGIQFYIYDMFAAYDDGVRVVDHTESYKDPETFNSEYISTLHVEFNAP